MNALASSEILNNYQLLFLGLFGGLGIGVTAYTQARCSACASEAFAETGQGFGNYMMIIGICETVALFVMVLSILLA
jgi:V/A-type H+-transporting ATPase subunit K